MRLYSELFEDKIRNKAHDSYENGGRVDGRNLDKWLEAERVVFATCRTSEAQSDELSREGMSFDGSDRCSEE